MLAKSAVVKKLSSSEFEYLRRVGLSFDAIDVYELLLSSPQLTAHEISLKLNLFSTAVYRLCYELEGAKLITINRVRPRRFVAVNKQTGLNASFENEKQVLENLIKGNVSKPSDDIADLIIGRQAVYDAYINHAASARNTIRVYSIGIAYSEDLEKTQASARRRGVAIHHIVQQKNLRNQHVIVKWQRLGVRMKYAPAGRGVHFYLIDEKIVCVTFSDPEETENRLSFVTNNVAAIQLFSSQFETLWREAKEISN